MRDMFAYIDESGNSDLDISKAGASKYFILAAILVEKDDQERLQSEVEKIRVKYFQSGEIKSSNVRDKNDQKRRVQILDDILKIDFKFFAVVVDKESVHKDSGLKYKKPFIKFVNGLIYNRLFSSFMNIQIFADEHGSKDFMDSFKEYLNREHRPDLFWKSDLELVSSKDNVLVQLADFLVGTLAKVYEGKKTPQLFEQYLKLLDEKSLGLVEWPTKYQAYFPLDITTPDYDQFIHQHALNKAEIFLQNNSERNDDETEYQVCVLGYLVFKSRFAKEKNYISTKELLDHLFQRGHTKVTEQAIRSTIVAKLRDKDVIIASCNKGYKIPCKYSDLFDFVDRVNGQVLPLIERLNKARNSYLLASKNEVDLLKGPNYPILTEFLNLLNK